MKQVSIFDRIFLLLDFVARLRPPSVVLCLRRLASPANSARCSSAGSTNLRAEVWLVWTESTAISLYVGCCRTGSGTAGSDDVGVSGFEASRDGGRGVFGDGGVVRVRCGITSLIEDRLFRPRANRGVFGLSGGELCVPTVERPENIWFMLARTLSILDGGG